MADNSFTFWANMKEAIDVYEGDPVYQYKLYDALTEYALYGVWPEDDGSREARGVISFVQSLVPSIDRSRNFFQKKSNNGEAGGKKQKVSDEQIIAAITICSQNKGGIPTRDEVCEELLKITGVSISAKTVTRRFPDDKKKEIAEEALKQNSDVTKVSEEQSDVANVSHRNNFIF